MYGFVREQLSPRRGNHYLQPAEIVLVKEGRPKIFWQKKGNRKRDVRGVWAAATTQAIECVEITYRIDDERGHGMLDDLSCDHLNGGRGGEHAYKRARREFSASPTHSRETYALVLAQKRWQPGTSAST